MTEKATCTKLEMGGEEGKRAALLFHSHHCLAFAFPYDPPQPFYIQCSQLPFSIMHTVTDSEGQGS